MKDIPQFAVIGRVNKGKSSIVSALAEDDAVVIDSGAGTTIKCQEFPVMVDGRSIIILIDTPGFQQAPRALAWMKERETSAASRRDVVNDFYNTFKDTEDFVDECRLLMPILDGAGILYVVDGAKPFRRNFEAEMEILRWTGQPRMALINHIGSDDYTRTWRPALDQYFSVVRQFNAQKVRFSDRLELFQAFRELNEAWRPGVDEAIKYLNSEWKRRERESAHIIADMLADELTYHIEIGLDRHEHIEDKRPGLESKFHDWLRKRERKSRQAIEQLYRHNSLEREETDLDKPVFQEDLFAESTWEMLGLTSKQLLTLGAITGAAIGGTLDAAVGGSSLFSGAIGGAIIGAGSVAYFSTRRFASLEHVSRFFRGGRVVRVGPHKNQNFPWVLLDRALLHYFTIRDYAHSRREKIIIDNPDDTGISKGLEQGRRRELSGIFTRLRKNPDNINGADIKRLEDILLEIICYRQYT
ncbi:MAG: GTPase/DUF3482 domain-containing protein [Desulfatiglans sp.]|nr:GTPase/DUF3482 domain-containing protein [Desulfatiglans sp.]